MTEYRFRKGSRAPADVSAEAVYVALEIIRKHNHGQLKPAAVLRVAKKPNHTLHPCFEWNDTVAANQHRLLQARWLIRSIEIVHEEQEARPGYMHVVIENKDEKEKYYQSSEVIIENFDEYNAAVRELVAKLAQAYAAVETARRLAQAKKKDDVNLQMLTSITEALATARTVASRLQ